MASPSQFLAFNRQAVFSSSRVLQSFIRTPSTMLRPASVLSARHFTAKSGNLKDYPKDLSTNSKTKTDKYPDDQHSLSKNKQGDQLEPQTANVKHGMDAQKSGSGGQATERKDSAGGVSKAKREHPEAPDPAIGMQDERGGRGG